MGVRQFLLKSDHPFTNNVLSKLCKLEMGTGRRRPASRPSGPAGLTHILPAAGRLRPDIFWCRPPAGFRPPTGLRPASGLWFLGEKIGDFHLGEQFPAQMCPTQVLKHNLFCLRRYLEPKFTLVSFQRNNFCHSVL